MIKIEHEVLASPEQMEFIVEGMRNSMDSWENSDSVIGCYPCGDRNEEPDSCDSCTVPLWEGCNINPEYCLGKNDHSLMQRLAKAGTDDRKFMRMMLVYVRITAPLYWWKKFDIDNIDTYNDGTVAISCSIMHKIQEKEFTLEDFSCEHLIDTVSIEYLEDTINRLNWCRVYYLEDPRKDLWQQMIHLLPSSYNQTRNIMMNYDVLANIYKSHKNMGDEWCEFCKWIESLPYSDLVCGC